MTHAAIEAKGRLTPCSAIHPHRRKHNQQTLRSWFKAEPVRYLNTFVESPTIDARLLSWWSARYGADGWLYYLVNGWQPSSNQSSNVPPGRPTHEPLRLRTNTSLLTDFSPRRYNRVANPHPHRAGVAFSNGDGIMIYPGKNGPLSSMRLEAFRDGLEDFSLLGGLPKKEMRNVVDKALTFGSECGGRIFNSGVNVTVDATGLEALRRVVASVSLQIVK